MSDHSLLFAETGLASLVASQGDESRVRYVSAAGVEIAVTSIVAQETFEEIGDQDGRDVIRVRTVLIRATDVEFPRLKATCWVDGVEYAVRDVANTGDGFARVSLVRSAASEVTRSNYRREQIRPQSQRR